MLFVMCISPNIFIFSSKIVIQIFYSKSLFKDFFTILHFKNSIRQFIPLLTRLIIDFAYVLCTCYL